MFFDKKQKKEEKMINSLIARASFIRHGQSAYTDQIPDLTKNGFLTMRKAAELIKQELVPDETPFIYCSPKARTISSANIVYNAVQPLDLPVVQPLLNSFSLKNQENEFAKFQIKLDKLGPQAVAKEYMSSNYYEFSKNFEPRSLLRIRFYHFLSSLILQSLYSEKPPHFLCLSHFELLFHLPSDLFSRQPLEEKPLDFGEFYTVAFYRTDSKTTVKLQVSFRKKQTTILFDFARNQLVGS